MLKEFYLEWENALRNQVVTEQFVNTNTKKTSRTLSTIKFRDKTITISSGVTNSPKGARIVADLYCQETDKWMQNSTNYPNKAKCAIAILNMLESDKSHEAKVIERTTRESELKYKHLLSIRSAKLIANSKFTPDEVDVLMKTMAKHHHNNCPLSWEDITCKLLIEFSGKITGRDIKWDGYGSVVPSYFIEKMYSVCASIISKASYDRYSNMIITDHDAKYEFQYPPKLHWSKQLKIARSIYNDIFDHIKSPSRFMHFMTYVAAYYEYLTKQKLEDKINEVIAFRQKRIEMARTSTKQYNNSGIVPIKNEYIPVIMQNNNSSVGSIGDTMGNILDKAKEDILEKEAENVK